MYLFCNAISIPATASDCRPQGKRKKEEKNIHTHTNTFGTVEMAIRCMK